MKNRKGDFKMNKLKINGLVLAVLIILGGSSLWAHSDAHHRKDPRLIRHEVKESLKDTSIPEMWTYIDSAVKDLALTMKEKYGSKKSKEELIRLKKALDILKEKRFKEMVGMAVQLVARVSNGKRRKRRKAFGKK